MLGRISNFHCYYFFRWTFPSSLPVYAIEQNCCQDQQCFLWWTHTGNLSTLSPEKKIIREKKCPIFHQPLEMKLCFRWKYWKYKSSYFQLKQISLFFLFIYRWNHSFSCQTNLWNMILSLNSFKFFCLFWFIVFFPLRMAAMFQFCICFAQE